MIGETFKLANCTCLAETPKSLLISCPDLDEAVWIPKSQVHADSEVYSKEHEGTLVIMLWVAETKGWV